MVVGRAAKGREAQEDGFKLITGLRGRREDRSFDGEFRLSTREQERSGSSGMRYRGIRSGKHV